jgi:hypothetical protein
VFSPGCRVFIWLLPCSIQLRNQLTKVETTAVGVQIAHFDLSPVVPQNPKTVYLGEDHISPMLSRAMGKLNLDEAQAAQEGNQTVLRPLNLVAHAVDVTPEVRRSYYQDCSMFVKSQGRFFKGCLSEFHAHLVLAEIRTDGLSSKSGFLDWDSLAEMPGHRLPHMEELSFQTGVPKIEFKIPWSD